MVKPSLAVAARPGAVPVPRDEHEHRSRKEEAEQSPDHALREGCDDDQQRADHEEETEADAATCAAYGNASGEMEATTKKLGALARSIEDEPLRRRLLQFEEHASGWAAAAKRTQEACSRRNSSAMVAAMGELTHHGAQFRFVSADIISYCKRP